MATAVSSIDDTLDTETPSKIHPWTAGTQYPRPVEVKPFKRQQRPLHEKIAIVEEAMMFLKPLLELDSPYENGEGDGPSRYETFRDPRVRGNSFVRRIEIQDLRRLLLGYISKLEDHREREVATRLMDPQIDLSLEETAIALDTNLNDVKKLFEKARRKLRYYMAGDPEIALYLRDIY